MKKLLVLGLVALCVLPVLLLKAESCPGILFKRKKLPRECIKESPCGPRTIFIPQSQGANSARQLAGWKEYLPGCDGGAWGNLSLTLEYTHSFKGERLAQYLFGSTQLTFSGSQVANRGERDLLADYFGLPTDFKGAIAFKPRIENIILDFNYHLGLDEWCSGLYFKFNAPVVTTRWDLGICNNEMNNIDSQDIPVFPACYMAEKPVRTSLSIRNALSGRFVFGDMEQPLMFGAFPCGRVHKTRVSHADLIFGWNFIADECAHAGVYFLSVVPFGNRPQSKIIFEPIIGNGNLWELGPGFSGHVDLIRHGCHTLSLYADGAITHQFKRFQIRSFDLIGHGPLSRYMLLKEFDENNQYDGTLINAIDFSTRCVRVGGSVKFDGAVKLSYFYNRRCSVDVGYSLYARTKEKLRFRDDLFPSDLRNRRFGIKGTENVRYQVLERDPNNPQVTDVNLLSSTQNRATIHQGAALDNPAPIILDPSDPPKIAIACDSPTTGDIIRAQQSDPPLILTSKSLDITSAAVPHQLAHKVFFHGSYTAFDCAWEPQFGFGGEIQFDGRSELMSSLNQWGVWFKFAMSY